MRTKGSRKRISDEIREKTKILLAQGYSYNSISKKLNISKDSIHRIGKEIDNLEQLRTDKKREMAESLWNLAIEMKEQITKKKLKESSAAKLVISLATLIDKALLLTGDATEILGVKTEKELTKELSDLQQAEKELQLAWDKAEAKRKAEEKGKDGKS